MDRFEPIFEALNATGTRYVVVGGVAVNLHGHQRLTKDLDLVIELVSEHALRALQALAALGYQPRIPVRLTDFADEATRQRWVHEKNMLVFQMYNDHLRLTVDVFVQYPLPFEELWGDAVDTPLWRTSVRIASLAHLIRMKQDAGRPRDLADVEALREVERLLAEPDGPDGQEEGA